MPCSPSVSSRWSTPRRRKRRRQRLGVLEVHRGAERRLELAAVRLEDRGAAVERRSCGTSGSTTIGMPARRRQSRSPPAITARHEHALVVVLEHQRVGLADARARTASSTPRDVVGVEVGVVLLVEADDLLRRARRRASWSSSAASTVDERRAASAPMSASMSRSTSARRVVADGRHQVAAGAERRDVLGDVGRAAEGVLALADADDRDRRLGRDAVDVAAQVDVEHRVADDRRSRWSRAASEERLEAVRA